MKLLFIISFFLLFYPDIMKALYVYQQGRYQKGRYLSWLKEHAYVWKDGIILHLVLWLFVLVYQKIEACILAMLIEGIIHLYQVKDKVWKPKMTARIKRFIVIYSVCLLILLILLFDQFIYLAWFCFLMKYLNWFLLFMISFVMEPFEFMIKKYYVSLAKKRLKHLTSLKKVGITGSYGKTSTKQILYHLIRLEYETCPTPASYNNEMGLTRTIREFLKEKHEVLIAEMGADHVGEIERLASFIHPSIGIITGIGPQHIQTFGSMNRIIKEKMKLVEALPEDGCAILNMDNPHIRDYVIHNQCNIIRYGIDSDDVDMKAIHVKVNQYGTSFLLVYQGMTIPFHTHLLGKQHVSNILGAIACAKQLGISWDMLQKRVVTLPDVPHRMQLLQQQNYFLIDNAYNSNPTSAQYALDVLKQMKGRKIIMTPGFIDLGDYQKVAHYHFGKQIAECASIVILVGRTQIQAIYDGLLEACFDSEKIMIATDRDMAFQLLRKVVKKGDIVLIENDLPQILNK